MKKLLSIVLCLCMLIPSVMTLGLVSATGTFSNQEGNLLHNPQFNYSYDGSAYTIDGWKLPSIATVEQGADGYNIVKIATSTTDLPYALSSTVNLNLDTDKYYKFSIIYKLENPPSGQFNINNGVFFAYKYNNNYVNRGSLSKNSAWTEASFIMYGGDVTENAWDKFFAVVSNYSRCTLSVKMPSVTVYNPDELDLKQDVVSENLIPNGDLESYDSATNTFENFLIESTSSAWYNSHSKEVVTIEGAQKNALRLSVNKENENRRARMLFDGNSFSKTGTYKFSLWIKLENSSATGIFDNNSKFGAVKLYFHHGTTNNVSTALVQTKEDWQKLEFILDESVHGGSTWWDLNQFAVGIQVYSMQCDILLADLRLEAVPITISADTAQNGTIKINRTTAVKGDSLQVLATPDSGYKLKRLYYTDGETETDITSKKQTVAVSKTVSGHNATVYESVASDKIYSCVLSQIADYTVKADFVSENEPGPEPSQPSKPEDKPSEEAAEGEYLDNYDFEAFSSGKAVNWTEGNFGSASITYSTDAHGGKYSLLIESSNRNGVPYIAQPFKNYDASKLYEISMFAKTIGEGDRSYDGGGLKLRVSYKLNGVTSNISSSGYETIENWTEITKVFQIPEGATDVKAVVILDCLAGKVLIDDIKVTPIGDALVYQDGQFTNGGFETYYKGEFVGWNFANGGNSKNSATQEIGRTGKAAVLRDTNTDQIVSLSQKVTLDRTKKYRISFYVKGTYDDDTSFYVPSWGGAYVEFAAGDYTVTSDLITSASPYKKVSVVVDGSMIPEGTDGTVKFVMKYMRGIIYLDDAEIAEYTGEDSELEEKLDDLYNPSFEEGKGNTFEYWTKSAGPNITLEASSDAKHKKRAVKVVSTSRDAVASLNQNINNIDNEKRYCISVWVKSLGKLDFAYTGAGVKLSVNYKLGDETVSTTSSVIKEMSDWTKLKHYFQIPSGATDIKVKITFDCIKGEILVDNVELDEVGSAVEKAEGKFANGGFEEYFDGEFVEWSFSDGGNSKNSATQGGGRTGKAAVLRDTNTDHIMSISQKVTLNRTKKYQISFYVKGTYDDDTSFYVPSWGGAYVEFAAGDYSVTSELVTSAAPYKKVSVIVDGSKIPEGAMGTVKFVMKYMRGIIYLDDAEITEYTGEGSTEEKDEQEDKLKDLYNLSFEEGEGNTFEYWMKSAGPNISLVSSKDAYHKKRAVKAVSTNRNAVASLSQSINNIDYNKRYCLSVWVKSLSKLDFSYTGAGVKLSVSYKLDGSNVNTGSSVIREMSDWTKLKHYFQIPKAATDVKAVITFDCLKGKVLVDKVELSVVGDAIEKKDGQFANGGFEEYYDGVFAEWSFNNGGNTKNSVTQDSGRTGKAAVLRDTNTDHIMSLSQSVVLDRTKKYKVSFFVSGTSDDDTDFYVPAWGGAYIQLSAGDYTVKSEMITSSCRFRQLSLIVDGSKIPEGVAPRVSFVMQYMRGIIYLDDAKLEIYDGTQVDEPIVYEDLYNLSFEEGKGNSFDDWNKNTGPAVEIVASSNAHDGKRAVMMTSTNRNAVARLYQNINNWDHTKRYRITVWAKTLDEVDVAYDGGGIKLQVTYKDKDGKAQSSSSAPKRTLDDWTKLYVDYQIPKGASDVRVNLMTDCLKGDVVFDDMTISVIGKAVKMPEHDPLNLASNFSFENGQDGSFPGWYWWTNNSKNTCEVGDPHSGAQSAKVTSKVLESSAQLSWDTTSVETSGWYQFSVWVKTEDIVPLSAGNGGACISMQFKKPGGNTNIKVYRSELLVGTNGWTQLIVRGRFPEGCTRVVFAMALSQATGVVYWDDVDIRKIEYKETNLLKNGSFDEADIDGNLLYWEKETDDWSFASFSHENNTAIVNNAGICSSYYYQDIEDLLFGSEYILSGNVSADSVVSENGGAAAILEMIDVYGNVVERRLCNEFLSSTSEAVTKFNIKFKLAENCKKVRILLACNEAAGSAIFSDFRLVVIDDYLGEAAAEPTVLQLKSPEIPVVTPISVEKGFNFLPIIIAVSVAVVAAGTGALTLVLIRKKKIK